MNISELLEVAIGLVFTYTLVSMACSQIQEFFARWLNWRAKDLEVTIRNMLENPPTGKVNPMSNWAAHTLRWSTYQSDRPSTKFVDNLYAHPLITSLIRNNQDPNIGPEVIPARNFALALFDTVMSAGTDGSLIQKQLKTLKDQAATLTGNLTAEQQKTLFDEAQALSERAAGLAASTQPEVAQQLRKDYEDLVLRYPLVAEARQVLQAAIPSEGPVVLEQFRRGALLLGKTHPELRKRLESLLVGVTNAAGSEEATIAAMRDNAEKWFDATMQRATIWYKINAQKVLFAIGLVFALLLNIDTIAVSTTLWREPTVRQAVVDQASKLSAPSTTANPTDPRTVVTSTVASLSELQLPIGWPPCATPQAFCPGGREVPRDLGALFYKVVGILLTALAIAQGGPFWFEVLSKLISIGETTRKEQAAQGSSGVNSR